MMRWLVLLIWCCSIPAFGQEPVATDAPDTAAQLGAIEMDRAARSFSAPGRFLLSQTGNAAEGVVTDVPISGLLEYLAVKRQGRKAYEALLELDVTAAEFNLACLLIGFDPERATLPKYHFDPTPVEGDRAEIWVEWEQDGETVRVPPARLVLVEGEPAQDDDWRYTGSTFIGPGDYLAERAGTLIGFVHDQDSIIEHRIGIGLDAPNPPKPNLELLPPDGTPIRVIVRNLGPGTGTGAASGGAGDAEQAPEGD